MRPLLLPNFGMRRRVSSRMWLWKRSCNRGGFITGASGRTERKQ